MKENFSITITGIESFVIPFELRFDEHMKSYVLYFNGAEFSINEIDAKFIFDNFSNYKTMLSNLSKEETIYFLNKEKSASIIKSSDFLEKEKTLEDAYRKVNDFIRYKCSKKI